MSELKVGIFGFGGIAELHTQKMKEVGDFKVLAAYDTNPGRLALAKEKYGIEGYEDLERFLGSEISLVVVCTPHKVHAENVIRAVEARKHVIVEKPMCMTVEEADKMIEASERNKVMLTVFQNRRWDSDFLTVKKAIKDGILGEVFCIQSRVMGFGLPGGWRALPEHGGMLYDWGAHLVDQMFQIMGYELEKIEGFSKSVRLGGTIDYGSVTMYFKNGCVGEVEVSWIAKESLPRWFVLGTKGGLKTTGGWNDIEIVKEVEGKKDEKLKPKIIQGDWGDFYRNIREVLLEGKDLVVKPREVREVIRVLETVANKRI